MQSRLSGLTASFRARVYIVSLLTYLLSVLSLSLGFLSVNVLLFSMATCYLALVCVLYTFSVSWLVWFGSQYQCD